MLLTAHIIRVMNEKEYSYYYLYYSCIYYCYFVRYYVYNNDDTEEGIEFDYIDMFEWNRIYLINEIGFVNYLITFYSLLIAL